MASLNFNLKPTKDCFQIYAMVTHNGRRSRRSIGLAIPDMSHWDRKRQRVKSSYERSSMINSVLSDISNRFDTYIDNCYRYRKSPNLIEALAIIKGEENNISSNKLIDAFSLYYQHIKNTHSESSKRKYLMMKEQIEEYEAKKRQEIYLPDINDGFYHDFIDYLLNEQNNSNRTILRKLKYIRTVMQYMVDKNLFRGYDWKYKTKLKETRNASRVPLNAEERQAIWQFSTTVLQERIIVDAFILATFTGLRFGDLQQLSSVHIIKLEDGNWAIDMSLQKGNREHLVGIPEFVYERIKKYITPTGPLFRLPENGSANRTLQRICKKIGLNRQIEWREMKGNKMIKQIQPIYSKISFHFARYTYTRMLDDSGKQSTWIQKNLRHSKFSTTEGYLKSDDHSRIRESNRKLAI